MQQGGWNVGSDVLYMELRLTVGIFKVSVDPVLNRHAQPMRHPKGSSERY